MPYLNTKQAISEVFNQMANPDLYVEDKRTGAKEKFNFSDKYSSSIINKIIRHSIDQDVDPYTMLAVGVAETNLGNEMVFPGRIFHAWSLGDVGFKSDPSKTKYQDLFRDIQQTVDYKAYPRHKEMQTSGEDLELLSKAEQGIGALNDYIPAEINEFKKKMEYMKDVYKRPMSEEFMLQGYRGMGRAHGEEGTGYQTKSYGKKIIDLRENMIKKNTVIREMVEKAYFDLNSQGKLFTD